MRVDVQCHVSLPEYGEYLLENFTCGKAWKEGDRYFFDCGGKCLSTDGQRCGVPSVLGQMDKSGVDMAVITCAFPDPGWLPAEKAPAASHLANCLVKEAAVRSSGRFIPLAFLPWQDPEEAVKELLWAAENGFKGVMLFTQSGGVCPDAPALEPVYAACAKQGLPVVLHPNMPLRYDDLAPYGLVPPVGFVLETTLALLKMLSSGLLERVPDLKLLMPHAGGVLPALDGRLNENRKRLPPGAPLTSQGELVGRLRRGSVWYDTANASPHVLGFALNYFSSDKMLFASDYPFIDPGLVVDMLEAVVPLKEEREKIYWKNANALFELGL